MSKRDDMLEALDLLKMLTGEGMFEKKEAPWSRAKVEPDHDIGGNFDNKEVFYGNETERATRQRECAAEITEIANRLRDLNMLIDASHRNEYERTGKETENNVSADIEICAKKIWTISESVNLKGKLVKAYVRKEMTNDQAIYFIEEMFESRLRHAADNDFHKRRYGRDISDRIDQAVALVRDFLTRNESEKHKEQRLKAEEKRREEEAKRREEEAKRLSDVAKR
jgi:hypothetical protein